MTETICNIPYATQSATQKMDIYLPDGVKGPYPVIVWLHPGGFIKGDKSMIQSFVPSMLTRGYVAIGVNYRLAGETQFPAQIYDVKTAVRWIRANASRYNFIPSKIATWGISAGSTLAALLGTSDNVKELEDLSTGNAIESSGVNAVVSWYGPMDFTTLNAQRIQLGQEPVHDSEISGESQLLGGSISKFPEKYKAASPINYISNRCPPFYIQHGTSDQVIPYLQSVTFAGALEAVIGKAKVKIRLIENAGHFDSIHFSPENVNAAMDFLDEHLIR